MRIYQCDRCGKVVTNSYEIFTCNIDVPQPDGDKKPYYAKKESYDLCMDCALKTVGSFENAAAKVPNLETREVK